MSLLPATLRIDLKVGDTCLLSFEWNEDDGDPIDITGWECEFSVNKARKGGYGDWTYLTTSHPEVISIVPSDPDPIKLEITPTMTRLWSNGKSEVFQAELTLTDPDGRRTTLVDMQLNMRGEVRYEP